METHQQIEIDCIDISYSFSSAVNIDATDDEYIKIINASITGALTQIADDEKQKEIQLGRAQVYRIHLGNAINEGISFFDLYDERQEALDVAFVLFDNDFCKFQPNIKKCSLMHPNIRIFSSLIE